MKLWNMRSLLTLIIALGLFLAACGSDEETDAGTAEEPTNDQETEEVEDVEEVEEEETAYVPEAINPEVDVCDICAMAVGDDQFATQIVLQDQRSLKFDDIGCMYNWLDENGEDEVGEKFVRDYHSEEWITMDEATYVFDEGIQTPMAYGVISFKEASEAESFLEEHGSGDILNVDELVSDHKWEMMKHDHGHGDDAHDEHGEHEEQDVVDME